MEDAPCRQCGFAADRNYCAECGAPRNPAGRTVRASRVVLAPLYDYADHARAIFFPKALVEEVRSHRFGLPELLGFWLAAAALAALANAMFRQPSVTGVDLPILAEIADAAAAMLVLMLLYSPLHWMLNRGARGVRFGEFVLILLAVAALLYPWLTVIRGALTWAGWKDAAEAVTLVGTLFFLRAFAALYQRTVVKTLLWMMVCLLLVMLALAGLLGLAQGV